MKRVLLALALAPLAGCFISRERHNEPIPAERVAELVPGTTTADQALAILGAPSDVVQLGKRSAWRYDHALVKSAAMSFLIVSFYNIDAQADRVWLFFDEHDVLRHCGATLTAKSAEYTMPWTSSHE